MKILSPELQKSMQDTITEAKNRCALISDGLEGVNFSLEETLLTAGEFRGVLLAVMEDVTVLNNLLVSLNMSIPTAIGGRKFVTPDEIG